MNKIQYISQGKTADEQERNILQVLENGAKWIQLRWKDGEVDALTELAIRIQRHCADFGAIFILNDQVRLAAQLQADGVHLGLSDMKIAEARAILGVDKIIGGTANTYEDILQRLEERCDYIGLGPFRFTSTKQNLSPIVGLDGYRELILKLKRERTSLVPIIAIGGITLSDIGALAEIGLDAVAVSSALTQEPSQLKEMNHEFTYYSK